LLRKKVLWLGPPREAANAAFVKSGDLLFLLKDNRNVAACCMALNIRQTNRSGSETITDQEDP
jgi:hypothetical protein